LDQNEVLAIAKDYKVRRATRLGKDDLIFNILRTAAEAKGNIFGGGVLEIMPDGIGFLRDRDNLIAQMEMVF